MPIPIRVDHLVTGCTVEWERIEFKEGWNPVDVMHTLCAFANDFSNWGGGYIVVGVAEEDGRPVLPPVGLGVNELDGIQKELLNLCNRIRLPYFPTAEPVDLMGRKVLVIWAPAGPARPYEAPKSLAKGAPYLYYIRRLSSTVTANREERTELLGLANRIPFDDQVCPRAELTDLSLTLIKEFLHEIDSGLLARADSLPFPELCRSLNIVAEPDEDLHPKNVGVLFFGANPREYFPYARIEIVEFPDESGTDFTEKPFRGPTHVQLRDALGYLRNVHISEKVHKVADRAEAERCFNYPYDALEEALVNAVYHRSYEEREPIEVRVYPSRIEILSYPGPMPPLRKDTIGKLSCRRYRNSRIGDFLKELGLTEGKNTGIAKIRDALAANGSPPAEFDTDDERSYFITTLRAHPAFSDEPVNAPAHEAEDGENEPLNETANETLNETLNAREQLSPVEKAVLTHLGAHASATYDDVAAALGKSRATVARHIAALRGRGILIRVGPDKTGHWEVKSRE